MSKMIQKYEELKAGGWEFSHNENGSIIMQRIEHFGESQRVIDACEINKYGQVLPVDLDDDKSCFMDRCLNDTPPAPGGEE